MCIQIKYNVYHLVIPVSPTSWDVPIERQFLSQWGTSKPSLDDFCVLSFRNHLNVDKWDPLEYKAKLLGSKPKRWTEGRWLWSCKALHPHFVRLTRIPVRRRRWLQGRLTTSILSCHCTRKIDMENYNCHICVCKVAAKGSDFVSTKLRSKLHKIHPDSVSRSELLACLFNALGGYVTNYLSRTAAAALGH